MYSEAISYTSGGYGGFGSHRGLIASVTYSYSGATSSLAHTYAFAYDAAGRLTTAAHSTDANGDIGVGEPIAYDANGNIVRMRRGSTTATYTYYPGTNRVQNTDGTGYTDYGYDGRGNVTSAVPRNIGSITYDPVLNLPTALTKGSATTEYRYLGSRRVLKLSPGSVKTLYVHGASAYPLYEITHKEEPATSGGEVGILGSARSRSRVHAQRVRIWL